MRPVVGQERRTPTLFHVIRERPRARGAESRGYNNINCALCPPGPLLLESRSLLVSQAQDGFAVYGLRDDPYTAKDAVTGPCPP